MKDEWNHRVMLPSPCGLIVNEINKFVYYNRSAHVLRNPPDFVWCLRFATVDAKQTSTGRFAPPQDKGCVDVPPYTSGFLVSAQKFEQARFLAATENIFRVNIAPDDIL